MQNSCIICTKPTKNSTAIKTIHDYPDNTPLNYVNDTQEISENPPDPDPRNGGDDGYPPNNFDNDEPDNDKPQNVNDRLLQVMSNLATAIYALHQPAPQTDKVKVWESNLMAQTHRNCKTFLSLAIYISVIGHMFSPLMRKRSCLYSLISRELQLIGSSLDSWT